MDKPTVPFMHAFARYCAETRKQRGWTQTELAEKIGVTQSTVSGWELARKGIESVNIDQFCRACHIELDDALQRMRDIARDMRMDVERAPKTTSDETQSSGTKTRGAPLERSLQPSASAVPEVEDVPGGRRAVARRTAGPDPGATEDAGESSRRR